MVPTANISQYPEGDFPVGKQDFINCARQHNAPSNVIDTLNKLPDREFNGVEISGRLLAMSNNRRGWIRRRGFAKL